MPSKDLTSPKGLFCIAEELEMANESAGIYIDGNDHDVLSHSLNIDVGIHDGGFVAQTGGLSVDH